MAIVASEVESIHGSPPEERLIWYRFQDSTGAWHSYGPVHTTDSEFDIEGHIAVVADRVAASLADQEVMAILGDAT